MKTLLWLIAGVAILLAAGAGYVRWSNADMVDLTRARHAALPEVRSALLRYKADKGRFPEQLELMVPVHIAQVPAAVQTAAGAEAARRIEYAVRGDTASFTYHVMRGPDSRETYDINSGTFQRNK